MVKQKISERYLDRAKLNRLLTSLFGTGTFEIEASERSKRQQGANWRFQDEDDFVLITIPHDTGLTDVCFRYSD